jgi:transcription antitermination factor NusG
MFQEKTRDPVALSRTSHPWFALQVRSRYEHVVATHLGGRGYEYFLPLHKIRRRWSDRFQEIEQPLLPGYVFCRLSRSNRLPILTVPGVCLIVGVGKTPVPIEESEIAAIQATIKSGLPSQPWPFLRIGQTVKIDQGPLRGLEGILLEVRGQHRLVLSITLLQRSIAVQIEDTWVAPIPGQSRAYVGTESTPSKREPRRLVANRCADFLVNSCQPERHAAKQGEF